MTSSAACSFSACSRVHVLTGSVAGAYHHQPGPQAPAFSAIGGNSQAWTLEEPKRQPAGQGQPAGAGSGPQLQARPPGPCHIICCPLTWDRCVCLGTGHAVMLRRSFGQLPGLSAAPPQGVPGAVLGCLTAPNFLARCLHVPEASGAPSRSRRRRCRPTPGLCSMCMQTVAPHGCPQAQEVPPVPGEQSTGCHKVTANVMHVADVTSKIMQWWRLKPKPSWLQGPFHKLCLPQLPSQQLRSSSWSSYVWCQWCLPSSTSGALKTSSGRSFLPPIAGTSGS